MNATRRTRSGCHSDQLAERSHVEQVHQANVCLVNGQPGGVELDRVRSSVEILRQMTADLLHQVAGLKTRLDPGLDVGCWVLLAQPTGVLVDVDEQRDFEVPRADFSGGRLKRVALIEDRDQLRDDDILTVVQMALRQSETVITGDQKCSREVLAPSTDLTE